MKLSGCALAQRRMLHAGQLPNPYSCQPSSEQPEPRPPCFVSASVECALAIALTHSPLS